jgi:putative redox protein
MSIKINFKGGKKVTAQFRDFTVVTDQNINDGGENSAPTPFDYFLASIGTCAGAYILQFCQSRNIATSDIYIEEKIIYDIKTKRISEIKLEIHLPNNFPEKYKNAVLRAADLCKVKSTIEYPPDIDVFIKQNENNNVTI